MAKTVERNCPRVVLDFRLERKAGIGLTLHLTLLTLKMTRSNSQKSFSKRNTCFDEPKKREDPSSLIDLNFQGPTLAFWAQLEFDKPT